MAIRIGKPKASGAQTTAAIKEENVFSTIELAQLKQKGYITDDEYSSKKTELLKRL